MYFFWQDRQHPPLKYYWHRPTSYDTEAERIQDLNREAEQWRQEIEKNSQLHPNEETYKDNKRTVKVVPHQYKLSD